MIETMIAALAAVTLQGEMDMKAACEAFQAEYGGTADCSCLAAKAAADADLAAEFAKLTDPAAIEAAPDSVKAAIADCTEAAE